jgi:hypothetical protein
LSVAAGPWALCGRRFARAIVSAAKHRRLSLPAVRAGSTSGMATRMFIAVFRIEIDGGFGVVRGAPRRTSGPLGAAREQSAA